MKTISRPVINRLPVDVNQLDEFACRQLDRVCCAAFFFCTRDFAVAPLLPLQKFVFFLPLICTPYLRGVLIPHGETFGC